MKRLRAILFDNFLIKLFSLLFAVVLWMYASTRGQSEITFVVPLELREIPAGMVVVGNRPRQVDVRLRGDEVNIRNLSSKEVGAFISLKGAEAGESLYGLDSANIKAPGSVTITRVSPSEVRIGLDYVRQKQLPVRVRLRGKPAKGYRVAESKTDPETVTVTGPRKAIDKLDEVVTETVDVGGLMAGFEREVPLVRPDGDDISLSAAAVKAVVGMEKSK